MTDDFLIYRDKVMERTGYSESTLYRLLKAKKFPPPVNSDLTFKQWRNSDISRFIENPKEWKTT